MLDENLVFHKSAAGTREVTAPVHGLPTKLRRALIVVDGTKTVAELGAMFRPGEIDLILAELQSMGLVTLAGGALAPVSDEAPPDNANTAQTATSSEQFEEIRRRAMREISDRLGPNGDTLALKIERCATRDQLRAALREAETIMTSFLGAEYGRTFAKKVGRDLV